MVPRGWLQTTVTVLTKLSVSIREQRKSCFTIDRAPIRFRMSHVSTGYSTLASCQNEIVSLCGPTFCPCLHLILLRADSWISL